MSAIPRLFLLTIVLALGSLVLVSCDTPLPEDQQESCLDNRIAADTAPLPGKPPVTQIENVVDSLHGIEIVDPYRWLEDQESPRTREWIDVQNSYARAFLDPVPGRERLEKRFAELMKVDSLGSPRLRNGCYFFSKRLADQEQTIIYMRRGFTGKDEVLVDPHPMSEDRSTSVRLLDVSLDGSLVAYRVRKGGEDETVIRMLDVATRQHLPDSFPRALYTGGRLLPDKSGFYYARIEKEGPRAYFHAMGTEVAGDKLVFGSSIGPGHIIAASLSPDARYLIFTVFHGTGARRSDIYFQNLAEGGPVVPLVNDVDSRFRAQIGGDTLYLWTNWQASNGRIMAVDLADPARGSWRELIPETKHVNQGFNLCGGKIFVRYLENVVSCVKIFDTEGRETGRITGPALGTVSNVSGLWDNSEAFYSFNSFHIPNTIFRYDVADGTTDIWARRDIPVDSERFVVVQKWFESKDGTRVPMFILHARGIELDGSNPTLLTGYGGFNASLLPRFSAFGLAWAELGGVYVVANLRGGGEFGEEWHRAGMLGEKQNVYDDFIAAAEWLVAKGYTSPPKLAISGGSNGGLLVGAALCQKPDLFGAVICTYPLLDMVRYHMFLRAKLWIPEYGSADDPEQFVFLHAYSPYHNVKAGVEYPAVLLVTGDADTRVAPLHARKMTALLQSATASGPEKPVLLLYSTKAGHSGGTPVSLQIEEETDQTIFLCRQLGVKL